MISRIYVGSAVQQSFHSLVLTIKGSTYQSRIASAISFNYLCSRHKCLSLKFTFPHKLISRAIPEVEKSPPSRQAHAVQSNPTVPRQLLSLLTSKPKLRRSDQHLRYRSIAGKEIAEGDFRETFMSFRPGIDYQLKRRSRWFIAWKPSFCTRVLTVIIALGGGVGH